MFAWKSEDERAKYGPHDWVKVNLGHSSTACKHCCGTPAEIAVIGDLEHCEKRPPETDAAEQRLDFERSQLKKEDVAEYLSDVARVSTYPYLQCQVLENASLILAGKYKAEEITLTPFSALVLDSAPLIERYRAALRTLAIKPIKNRLTNLLGCDVCAKGWNAAGPEIHGENCLAAPAPDGLQIVRNPP